MKTAQEYASELLVSYAEAVTPIGRQLFIKKSSEVHMEVAVNEIRELIKMRNVSTGNGLMQILKEQRQKYNSICKIVNEAGTALLSITDFDETIREIMPKSYDWYVAKVLELNNQ